MFKRKEFAGLVLTLFIGANACAGPVGGASIQGLTATFATSNQISCFITDASMPGEGGTASRGTNAVATRSFDKPTCAQNIGRQEFTVNFGSSSVFADTGQYVYPENDVSAFAAIASRVRVSGLSPTSLGVLTVNLSGTYSAFADVHFVPPNPDQRLFGGVEHALTRMFFGFSWGDDPWTTYFPAIYDFDDGIGGSPSSISNTFASSYTIPFHASSSLELITYLVTEVRGQYEAPEPATLALAALALIGALVSRSKARPASTSERS